MTLSMEGKMRLEHLGALRIMGETTPLRKEPVSEHVISKFKTVPLFHSPEIVLMSAILYEYWTKGHVCEGLARHDTRSRRALKVRPEK